MNRHQWKLVVANIGLLMMSTIAVIVHNMASQMYFTANSVSMRIAAENAVRAGVQYLPERPTSALTAAEQSVVRNGVAPSEIVQAAVADHGDRLVLCLRRKVPRYIALMAVGLPSREIRVIASAQIRARRQVEVLADEHRWRFLFYNGNRSSGLANSGWSANGLRLQLEI